MNMILAIGCQCYNCGVDFPVDDKRELALELAATQGWMSGLGTTEDDEDGELSTVFACKSCSPLLIDPAPFLAVDNPDSAALVGSV